MAEDLVLLAGGMGDVSGGGLFAVEAGAARRIDTISTMGLAFDGARVARALRCMPEDGVVGEFVVSDARGISRYLRIDGAGAVHDVVWDGDELAVVSTWHNAVRWFGLDGGLRKEVRYPGDHDAAHLNCITRHDGVWYATMFGPLRGFREWDTPAREGAGRIVELETGRTIVDGLTSPHTPRRIDDLWLVCNSQECELTVFDARSGALVRRVACGLWTRGLAVSGGVVFVGACRRRRTSDSYGDAEIVVIDRARWEVVDRIAVPAQEIYDLTFVSRDALAGLERAFGNGAHDASAPLQWSSLTEIGGDRGAAPIATGEPLPWSDFRCRIEGVLPAAWAANEMREIAVRVTNLGASGFTSAAPAPVYASFKWLDRVTGAYVDDKRAHRTKLPFTLEPGASCEVVLRIVGPSRACDARLRVTLVQEGVSWFDDQDPSGALEIEARVVDPAPAGDYVPAVRPACAP